MKNEEQTSQNIQYNSIFDFLSYCENNLLNIYSNFFISDFVLLFALSYIVQRSDFETIVAWNIGITWFWIIS